MRPGLPEKTRTWFSHPGEQPLRELIAHSAGSKTSEETLQHIQLEYLVGVPAQSSRLPLQRLNGHVGTLTMPQSKGLDDAALRAVPSNIERRRIEMPNSIGSELITSTWCLSTGPMCQRTLAGANYVIRAVGAARAHLGSVLKLVTSGGIAGSFAELGPT